MTRPGIPILEWIFACIATIVGVVITGAVVGIFATIVGAIATIVRMFRKQEAKATEAIEADDKPDLEQAPRESANGATTTASVIGGERNEQPAVAAGQQAESLIERGSHLTYRGYLKWAGMKKREDVATPYVAYYVRLFNPKVKAPHELWGAGLRGALEDAGAEIGDLIRIDMIGHEPTIVNGKQFIKKMWAATVEKKNGKLE